MCLKRATQAHGRRPPKEQRLEPYRAAARHPTRRCTGLPTAAPRTGQSSTRRTNRPGVSHARPPGRATRLPSLRGPRHRRRRQDRLRDRCAERGLCRCGPCSRSSTGPARCLRDQAEYMEDASADKPRRAIPTTSGRMEVAGSPYTAVSSHQQTSIAAPLAASINQNSTNESPRIRCNRFSMVVLPLVVNVE